ncbi:MAG: alcohol dehydrogenase catalytic domain-containing protein [Victivallales bacterium]
MSLKNTIPEKMLAWPLFGAGMDNLGKNNQPCTVEVPDIGGDELLVKIDAIGLCFSDVKLIRAGMDHPRVVSPDLATQPVIPGHEAVMTIVRTGSKVSDKFKAGQRFIIQADIYIKGKGFAYGYAIDGGMAEYSRIDQRVLNGDEGCYLLPLADSIPAGIAALIEPWTCVIASYMIENRKAPLKNGSVLIACEEENKNSYEPGKLLVDAKPANISVLNLSQNSIDMIKKAIPSAKIEILKSIPEKAAFDDIFICEVRRQDAEKIAKLANRNAVISFIGNYPDEPWSFDVGGIHYNGWYYQGTKSNILSDAYNRNVRSKLKKGGTCWLVGGAGAMGQMHTQLAIESSEGPSRILMTDMDDTRIKHVCELLDDKIKERKIEFKTLNPKAFPSPAAFEAEVAKFAEKSGGFDDIVMLVPVVPVVNSSAPFLKKDGLMNIFAGIPAGKEGIMNVRKIAEEGARYIGSSGSLTAHLRHTLKLVEEKKLNPATALAAIGGMRDLKKGLEAVADAKFPGKTVIFPHCEFPITTIERISDLSPDLARTLSKDGSYTVETEKVLFEKFGKK